MFIKMPDSTRENLSKHIKDGIFVGKRISFWHGSSAFSFGNKQRLTFVPSKILSHHDVETAKIRFQIRRLLYFYTFKTKYGVFVPAGNIKTFWDSIEDLKRRQNEVRDHVLNKYDDIVKELYRRSVEIARFRWTNDLACPGDPPQSFIEDVSDKTLKQNTKEMISKRFRFDIFQTNPIISYDQRSYGSNEEIDKINGKVVDSLYNSIITNRCTFLKLIYGYQKKITPRNGPYKALANVCKLYGNSLFYGDEKLMNMLESLRISLMQSFSRSPSDIIHRIEEITECIVKNDSYLVGLIYERKV